MDGALFPIGHSDQRHLEFSVLLIFFRSKTVNYRTTGTLVESQILALNLTTAAYHQASLSQGTPALLLNGVSEGRAAASRSGWTRLVLEPIVMVNNNTAAHSTVVMSFHTLHKS